MLTTIIRRHGGSAASLEARRAFSIFPKIPLIKFFGIRRFIAQKTVNKFKPERVAILGPDLACLEWLMEAGATSVKMSDGTELTRISQMRAYIASQGFDLKKLPAIPPESLPPPLNPKILASESLFAERWAHAPKVHIEEVDGSDSAITDEGFQYFTECRGLKVMKLNHCDYFTDHAFRQLALGRPALTLRNFEVCLNPSISDSMVYWIIKLKALRRLHFYFLPYVANRAAVLRQLKMSLPKCAVTFPETNKLGYGYDG
uniref:ATP synthase subunit s, mitochondrial n=1 Tax=Panagrellus redivivus TaxID=6233 RepID=A0A7E4W3X0_PANRE